MMKKYKIYRDFVTRKKNETVLDIADRHKVGRQQVYQAVDAVRNGSETAVKKCEESMRLNCLWEARYKPWYTALPKGTRNAEVINEKKLMIHAMSKDGFSALLIAEKLKMNHSTILHHLKV